MRQMRRYMLRNRSEFRRFGPKIQGSLGLNRGEVLALLLCIKYILLACWYSMLRNGPYSITCIHVQFIPISNNFTYKGCI